MYPFSSNLCTNNDNKPRMMEKLKEVKFDCFCRICWLNFLSTD